MPRIGQVLLLLIVAASIGCGTYANLYPRSWLVAGDFPERHKDEKPVLFGGVRRDSNNLPLGLLDLPFSAIGDLATLPIVLPAAQPGADSKQDFRVEPYYFCDAPDSFYLSVTPGNGLRDVSGRWIDPATLTELVRLKKCPMTITLCPAEGELSKESIAVFKDSLKEAVALGANVVFYRELYWESQLKSAK